MVKPPLAFTAIVPTIGRYAPLERLLRCLARQQYPVLEVIIVDQLPLPADENPLRAALGEAADTPCL